MFGWREEFAYLECGCCRCLQIAEIPLDMGRYYPENYYSFRPDPRWRNKVLTRLRRLRNHFAITGTGLFGRLLFAGSPDLGLQLVCQSPLTPKMRILDVGCGAGHILYSLQEEGFTRLLGIDPYLKEGIVYPNGLRILKNRLDELDSKFDVVMFNHVFEHLPDPKVTLLTCHRLLSTMGKCLLRIPIVSSYAWKHYGVNWVQLDAPRHLFLHSMESIDILASETGFRIEKVTYDSTAFQFWGSEQYALDIPLSSPASYSVDRSSSIFTLSAIREYRKKAKELNVQREGDQAAFLLRRV